MFAKASLDPPVEARPRRWPVRLLFVFVTLLVVVWAAPIIATWTPLLAALCSKADAYIDGSVRVSSASLGWFSPVVLYNVEVRDAADQTIAQIPKLESERSLVQLLLHRDDLGAFRADKPLIDLTFVGNESNLEKLLAKSLQPRGDAAQEASHGTSSLPKVQIEIVNANVNILDADTRAIWRISDV